jgi:hypothetical protein
MQVQKKDDWTGVSGDKIVPTSTVDNNGNYEVSGLPASQHYMISVEGFNDNGTFYKPTAVTGVEVGAGETTTRNISLESGGSLNQGSVRMGRYDRDLRYDECLQRLSGGSEAQ